jgi:hypothetical protein
MTTENRPFAPDCPTYHAPGYKAPPVWALRDTLGLVAAVAALAVAYLTRM